MANGKFIVCNKSTDFADTCADCGDSIKVDGARIADAAYICTACLEPRLARNDADEVDVTIGTEDAAPTGKLEGDELFKAMAECKAASDGDCDCRWCKHVNPLAVDIAKAIKAHPEADKLTRVYVLIRMLGEAAVAANSMLGLHHRDASFTAGVVARELHRVADREHEAAVQKMRPMVEEALREAGIDIEDILRSKLPREQTH